MLSLFWKPLWEVGPEVLPLGFYTFKGGVEEAAATLLLNLIFHSAYLQRGRDLFARSAYGSRHCPTPDKLPRQLETDLQEVVDLLRVKDPQSLKRSYEALTKVMREVSPRVMRRSHPAPHRAARRSLEAASASWPTGSRT